MKSRTQYARKSKWCTLEKFWNTSVRLTFIEPGNSKIRIRYGPGWFSFATQLQTLDGTHAKELRINRWSLIIAKVQINAGIESYVTYSIN